MSETKTSINLKGLCIGLVDSYDENDSQVWESFLDSFQDPMTNSMFCAVVKEMVKKISEKLYDYLGENVVLFLNTIRGVMNPGTNSFDEDGKHPYCLIISWKKFDAKNKKMNDEIIDVVMYNIHNETSIQKLIVGNFTSSFSTDRCDIETVAKILDLDVITN